MRILMVEPDWLEALRIGRYFEQAGCNVDYAVTAASGVQLASSGKFHAVIISTRGLKFDGAALCRKMRMSLPVTLALMVIAERPCSNIEAAVLDSGADDCVTRSTDLLELRARLNAALRRRETHDRTLCIGGLQLDVGRGQASRQGTELLLSPVELTLLRILMERSPLVVTGTELRARLAAEAADADLERHMETLRQAVDGAFDSEMIRYRKGSGYQIARPAGSKPLSVAGTRANVGARHIFDGQSLTMSEIRQRVPVLSAPSIRRHLREGRNTSEAMLAYDGRKAISQAVRRRRSQARDSKPV
jgi:DNA-binding response OmpR family regulator